MGDPGMSWPGDPYDPAVNTDRLPVEDWGSAGHEDDWLNGPAADPHTGEVIDPPGPTTSVVEGTVVIAGPVPSVSLAAETPRMADTILDSLDAGGALALDWLRSPELVQNLTAALAPRLREELEVRAATAKAARAPGKVTEATVAHELGFLADAHTVLGAIGSTFTQAAKLAASMAGEVMVDVMPEAKVTGGTHTVKVGSSSGDVKVTRTQATQASVRDDEVVDVLVADLIADRNSGEVLDKAPTGPLRHYAAGARDALMAFRQLMGPLPWRTSDLEKMQRRLEGLERHDLAIRLGHAYGRVASGNPRTTIKREG